jgi:hypothetical protein
MSKFFRRLGWTLLAVLVVSLVGLVVARAVFTQYLHSEGFRRSLGEGAANALRANRADFAPLQFDGALVYGENFHAARDDGGGFSTIDADQLRATFDWHGLLHHTVQVDELAIQRLDVKPPASGQVMPEIISGMQHTPAPLAAPHEGWIVDLRKAVISEANWHWSIEPAGGITGVGLTLTPAEGRNAWIIHAQGGTLSQSGWPALELDSASLRWQSPALYINSASLRNGTGRVSVTEAVETRESLDLQAKLEGVDIQPLLPPDWRQRLTGKLNGDVNVHAPLGTADAGYAMTVSGSASLADGQLTALPILDQIGAFTHTARFRQLELTRAKADFTHTQERLEVRNLVVESEGLIRVEGAYTIEKGEIAGNFQVGLTPSTLQWIPGSQEQIFTESRGGYHWTAMRLSGPAAHPKDDLTPRLVAATANGVIEGVEGTVKKAGESVLDLLTH